VARPFKIKKNEVWLLWACGIPVDSDFQVEQLEFRVFAADDPKTEFWF
jgi:hypothetical protein